LELSQLFFKNIKTDFIRSAPPTAPSGEQTVLWQALVTKSWIGGTAREIHHDAKNLEFLPQIHLTNPTSRSIYPWMGALARGIREIFPLEYAFQSERAGTQTPRSEKFQGLRVPWGGFSSNPG
jgi:hypothetical protein